MQEFAKGFKGEQIVGSFMTTQKWKKFERLVAKVQQDLSPQAIVTANDKIEGKITGTKRQIDVSVRQRVGQYEILIAIECKDLSVPIDVKGVEEAIGLIQDIGANKGVIVSASGFTAAAKKRGENAGLKLYRLIDCGEHDWKTDVSIPVLCDCRKIKSFRLRFSGIEGIIFQGGDPKDLDVYNENNHFIGKIVEFLYSKWNNGELPIEPGEHKDIDFIGIPTKIKYGLDFFHVKITAILTIEKGLYFNFLPLSQFSGFRDEVSESLIMRRFETTDIDMTRIEKDWHKVAREDELAVKPIFCMRVLDKYDFVGSI